MHDSVSTWNQTDIERSQIDPVRSISRGLFFVAYDLHQAVYMAWLRILSRVPNSILWLLRFPSAGEENLLRTARLWAEEGVASRIHFTDVAPKQLHIARVVVADIVLDTFEVGAQCAPAILRVINHLLVQFTHGRRRVNLLVPQPFLHN